MAAPVAKGEELELDVDSLAYGGNGVARLDGFVVFVRRGLPGDRVRARVTKVKRSHAEALATEVLRPGPERVEAPCAHFPACGGCRFQDLAYEAQLEQKQLQVRDALQRLGGIPEPPLEQIVPCEPEIFHYRNKLEYSFTSTPSGPALGFHKAGRWDEVLEIERCWLVDELGNRIRDAVRDWAREEGLEPYSQVDGSGYLRHLVVRQGRNTEQALVQLVTAPGDKFETGYFVDVLRRFPELSLAREALTVWGIEVSEESVACALENAEVNGIANAAFFAGNVGEVVEELLERSGPPEVVVVDPPRAGLAGKALRRLGRIGAPRLVYVSCNPTTLAGDVKALREDYGYELRRVTPVDMFPHTPHVECVALLERVTAPA
jgi:23S rRNA (uracil1939-C5)-methyltransferase